MDKSENAADSGTEGGAGDTDRSTASSQSTDKGQSTDSNVRSSRRKPMKTHKVAANFEEVEHYDDYLRDGIPDALLEGLGFSESGDQPRSDSGSPAMPEYDMEADDMEDDDYGAVRATTSRAAQPYTGKRRGRPPGRGRGRGAPPQPIVIQPSPSTSGGKRRGRPPKIITPTRVQPQRAAPLAPLRTPIHQTRGPAPTKQAAIQSKQAVATLARVSTPRGHPAVRPSVVMPTPPRTLNGAALAMLPVTEFNVWPVLEKLLAATQSMGMLLGSLKDDMKRTSAMIAAMAAGSSEAEHARKRREVATKLWRAFVAYKKSFDEIESFTRNTGGNSVGTSPNALYAAGLAATQNLLRASVPIPISSVPTASNSFAQSSGSRRPRNAAAQSSSVVIELSDSDDDVEEKSSPAHKQRKIDDDARDTTTQQTAENDADVGATERPSLKGKQSMAVESDNTSSTAKTDDAAPEELECQSSDSPDVGKDAAGTVAAGIDSHPENIGASNGMSDKDPKIASPVSDLSKAQADAKSTPNCDAKKTESAASSIPEVEEESAELSQNSADDDVKSASKPSSKTELFSSLRFEPLFEIQPLNGSKS